MSAPSLAGFILKVRDLPKCRAFYRDVLQLGNPVTDSNFRVEFQLHASSARLVLCRAREEEQLPESSRAALWIVPENPNLQLDILASCGYTPLADELNFLRPGVKCFRDPEGNPFYLVLSDGPGEDE